MDLLQAGALVQRRYRVIRRIGAGGMGAVYQAEDMRLGNLVALKQLLTESSVSARAFEREAQLLAALRHPALPVVIDHFSEAGGHFLVMQFIPGDDLQAMLARQRQPFAVEEVLKWTRAILGVLEYLHGRQPPIVHRDIKPANLKLTPDGEIVLLDFGLARGGVTTRPAADGVSILGWTPQYAPVEQIHGAATDGRSDLYACGATMYHLLTGRPPHGAGVRALARSDRRVDPLASADAVNKDVPAWLGQVVARAMALDAGDRYESALKMLAAIDDGEAGARPAAAVERAADRARRVDSALPSQAEVGRRIDLIVQVRFQDSPRLGLEDWPSRLKPEAIEQVSEVVRLTYPTDGLSGEPMPARLTFKVLSADFNVEGSPDRIVEVPPDRYSSRVLYGLTAIRAGLCRVTIEVYGADAAYLGALPVETEVHETPVAVDVGYGVGTLVLQVLAREVARILERPTPETALLMPAKAALPAPAVVAAAQPRAARPASRGRLTRWSLGLVPLAVLVVAAVFGLQWRATAPGVRPLPPIARAPETSAALPPLPPVAEPPPSGSQVATPPAAARAAGPPSAAPPASPPAGGMAGVTRLAPGATMGSRSHPGVTLTLIGLSRAEHDRVRLSLLFRNRSAYPAELVIDYGWPVLRDAKGRPCRVTADAAGTLAGGEFRTILPAGDERRHWIECDPAGPEAGLFVFSEGPVPAVSNRVRFADFEAVLLPPSRPR